MSQLVVSLVGMHFRPPAKQLLECLPSGARLILSPEPENPYDPKAIKVLVDFSEVLESQHTALREKLEGTGKELEELDEELIHLGYVADSDGKLCVKEGLPGNREVAMVAQEAGIPFEALQALLGFDGAGKPQVVVELGV